jgi:hypothetical protein
MPGMVGQRETQDWDDREQAGLAGDADVTQCQPGEVALNHQRQTHARHFHSFVSAHCQAEFMLSVHGHAG